MCESTNLDIGPTDVDVFFLRVFEEYFVLLLVSRCLWRRLLGQSPAGC